MNVNGSKLLKSAGLALSLGSLSMGAVQAADADPIVAGGDLLIVRPVSLAAAAVGTGLFVGTLPFTYVAGVHKEAATELVEAPTHFTFQRPLSRWN